MDETQKWLVGIIVLLATGWGTYVMSVLNSHDKRIVKLGEKLEVIEKERSAAEKLAAATLARLECKVEDLIRLMRELIAERKENGRG